MSCVAARRSPRVILQYLKREIAMEPLIEDRSLEPSPDGGDQRAPGAPREARVYGEGRELVWRESLGPGEVALFFVDADTGRARNEFGRRPESHWSRTCLVFPSLDEAVAYAERKVRAVPWLACRIFAREAADPVRVVASAQPRPERNPTWIRNRMRWGGFLIAIGVLGVALEWYYDWAYILFAMIGVKFLTIGFIRLGEGINYHVGLKRSATASDR